ncbi:MAG TPA: hypothetical protein VKO18_08930 [Terriglobia bacterium]|nr:hypothetical protein [Terriglobia bacterium]
MNPQITLRIFAFIGLPLDSLIISGNPVVMGHLADVVATGFLWVTQL